MLKTCLSDILKIFNADPDKKMSQIHFFYRIIDKKICKNQYTLQCINSKTTFKATLEDIIFEPDILGNLHPIQSCYIGIEHSKGKFFSNSVQYNTKRHQLKMTSAAKYQLLFEARNGIICFKDRTSQLHHYIKSTLVASNKELISEFESFESFYIGISAGKQLMRSKRKKERPTLRIIGN